MQLSSIRSAATTANERCALRMAGFVHVTGLPTRRRWAKTIEEMMGEQEVPFIIGKSLKPAHCGKHGYNNGMSVIITMSGEVWLRKELDGAPDMHYLTQHHCPNGGDAWVPCSNGETFNLSHTCRGLSIPTGSA